MRVRCENWEEQMMYVHKCLSTKLYVPDGTKVSGFGWTPDLQKAYVYPRNFAHYGGKYEDIPVDYDSDGNLAEVQDVHIED
jgi:hypothetical protein